MLILKGVLVGIALFIIGSLIYMLAASRLIRAPGIGIVSTNTPFLWLAFVASLAVGYVIAARGVWIIEVYFWVGRCS